MRAMSNPQFTSVAFLWPALVAESASEFASVIARELMDLAVGPEAESSGPDPRWTTDHKVALELTSVRLRDFSTASDGVATLVCAPFALHYATIADLAADHSLIAALQGAGTKRVFLTDWRSASPDMRFLSIDNYLADLNLLVDELGGAVNLVGLCQGGWMALVYAARFPAKVRKLVLAGAPIDLAAGNSRLSELAHKTPDAVFKELVDLGRGRVLGRCLLQHWGPDALQPETVHCTLQSSDGIASAKFRRLHSRFRDWYARTLNLPGTYYLQVVEQLFKENRLAAGRFAALGRRIDLSSVCCPLFLLAARDDDIVAPEQILATEHLVDSRRCTVRKTIAPCGHLGLFMGRDTLREVWPDIAHWLSHAEKSKLRLKPAARTAQWPPEE